MSDYLTDEEQLDKLRKWWEENGRLMAVAVAIAVLGIVGWNWYGNHRSEQVASASDLYEDYLEAAGTERTTIEQTLIGEFPDSTYRVLVLLRRAEAAISGEEGVEDMDGGRALLQEALAIADDEKLADLIRLRLARVLQQLDQSDAALATLAQVTSMGLRSQVQELKGDIHMTRGERRQAHEAYSAAQNEAAQARPLLDMKVADTADADGA